MSERPGFIAQLKQANEHTTASWLADNVPTSIFSVLNEFRLITHADYDELKARADRPFSSVDGTNVLVSRRSWDELYALVKQHAMRGDRIAELEAKNAELANEAAERAMEVGQELGEIKRIKAENASILTTNTALCNKNDALSREVAEVHQMNQKLHAFVKVDPKLGRFDSDGKFIHSTWGWCTFEWCLRKIDELSRRDPELIDGLQAERDELRAERDHLKRELDLARKPAETIKAMAEPLRAIDDFRVSLASLRKLRVRAILTFEPIEPADPEGC